MAFTNLKSSGKNRGIWLILALLALLAVALTGCGGIGATDKQDDVIVFADFGWDSAIINNRVAQFIIEHGYDYKTDQIAGETTILMQGLRGGDIDVAIEIWVDNVQEIYDSGIAAGDFIDLGTNFSDNSQGLFVPTYVIAGDPDRGIEPMAPGLKTIEDLPAYWEIFKDQEVPTKGRLYGAVPGWGADKILVKKIETYGLDETYNYFRPGSASALDTSIVAAYQRGEPWLGYYWTPTWIMGAYDLTLLEEQPYREELWSEEGGYGCAFPSVDVQVGVHKTLPGRAPDVVEFLGNYSVSSDIISEALAYMEEQNMNAEGAAMWFLRDKEDIWTTWVPEDVAARVKERL